MTLAPSSTPARTRRWLAVVGLATVVAGCAHGPARMAHDDFLVSPIRETAHRGNDDLLTAGMGLLGLMSPAAPNPQDPEAPTPDELRRRAIHTSWRGIADLGPLGAYGQLYGSVANTPGREYQAFAQVPGMSQPHRVLAQVPDGFDTAKRCLLVAPSSGSRGVYGAISVAGAFGLPRGCAVVYTDKGTGGGYYDYDSATGAALDGRRAGRDAALEFVPPGPQPDAPHTVAVKHAHSGDNPESRWGEQVLQAARFGLAALDRAFPEAAPFTAANTRIIAVAVSNGGGAVLKAGEADRAGLLAAVVAGEPNITPPGARSLYDFSTEAALYQPCIAASLGDAPALMPAAAAQAVAALRCASLKAGGLLSGATQEELVAAARAKLVASGWSEGALKQANINVALDLWRSVVATYAQAYARADAAHPLCGYRFAMKDAAGAARATTAAERALWWSDGAGIASVVGLGIIDGMAAAPDPALPALRCARDLVDGKTPEAQALQRGLAEVTASARPHTPLTVIVHGEDDGLVPPAFTSTPYVAAARANGARIAYWRVPHAQHFDAFLAVPDVGARNVPLLPYVYRALEQVLDHLDGRGDAPVDRRFDATPRGSSVLTAKHLAL